MGGVQVVRELCCAPPQRHKDSLEAQPHLQVSQSITDCNTSVPQGPTGRDTEAAKGEDAGTPHQ